MTSSAASLDDVLRGGLEEHWSRTAVWKRGSEYTYGQLLSSADALARVLAPRVDQGAAIGILAQRSWAAYVAVLASLLLGRPYVPISMKSPYERQLATARIAKCAVLISDAKSCRRHEELDLALGLGARRITDADLAAAPAPPRPRSAQIFSSRDDDLAYIMFTSGTTGAPKGVAVRRANLQAYLSGVREVAPLEPGWRCSQLFDLSFDLSVHDIFAVWTSGGALYAMDDEDTLDPVGFARRHELEAWFSVPSVVSMARRLGQLGPESLPSMRLSLFCGEALPFSLAEEWSRAAPNSRVFNLYGPTEATIAITSQEYRRADWPGPHPPTVPLGRPFRGSAAVVMTSDGAPAPPGEAGELWLGGPQIAAGYVNNDEETRARFVERAVEGHPWGRWYRTGDLARLDERHGLVFQGRLDDQMKVQGYRIELLEVEEALRSASGVLEVAAVGWPLSETGAAEGIVGFVRAGQGSQRDIISSCRAKLPSYMVPRKILFVEDLPLNSNGKVDRAALRSRYLENWPGSSVRPS